MKSLFDLRPSEKMDLALMAWQCKKQYNSFGGVRRYLISQGFDKVYIDDILRDGSTELLSSWLPIFSMAEALSDDVVPDELFNLCTGPTDGWFSETRAGGNKWVCLYLRSDASLYFCFGFPRGVDHSLREEVSSKKWVFKGLHLICNDDMSHYVSDGCELEDFRDNFWSIAGPASKPRLSLGDLIERLNMREINPTNSLSLC